MAIVRFRAHIKSASTVSYLIDLPVESSTFRSENCPSLVLGVSAGRLDVRHFSVSDLPAVAQPFDTLTQLAVAAEQSAAGQGCRHAGHARDGRQDVDGGRPSRVFPFAVAFSGREAPVTGRTQP